jgi:hypothetical protein
MKEIEMIKNFGTETICEDEAISENRSHNRRRVNDFSPNILRLWETW